MEQKIIASQVKIESWLRQQFQKVPVILTSSVDIRNAGFKLSPIDTNIFPAGFNNLSPDSYALAIQALQFSIANAYPTCQRILIIPEAHTRNLYYFESLYVLADFITKAGFEVRIGSELSTQSPQDITLSNGKQLTIEPIIMEAGTITLKDFKPCFLLLNNDLTEGIPGWLLASQQPIHPPPELGWHARYKTQHFQYYEKIANEFSHFFDIDPWLITPFFENCGAINFMTGDGQQCLQEKVTSLFDKIKQKYKAYNINNDPYIVLKADQGTYGMAVMVIKDYEDIINLNRKQKQKMSRGKSGKPVESVIIQEGVYSQETIGPNQSIAEPVIYMIGHSVIGGFYRVHEKKGPTDNLNAPGMHFTPLAFDECCNNPDSRLSEHAPQNRFYVYSVIARLALLASCLEAQSIKALP